MRVTEKKTEASVLMGALLAAEKTVSAESSGNVFMCGGLPNMTLRVRDSSKAMARRAASGRKTTGATWLAHRIFLDVFFTLRPNARVRTTLTTYKNAADYAKRHKATERHVIRHCGRNIAFGDL